MALRGWLRETLLPEEQLVGWAAAQSPRSTSAVFLQMALAALPGVGYGLSALMGAVLGPPTRVLVLTDHRLLALSSDKKALARGQALLWQAGVGEIGVHLATLTMTFTIRFPAGEPLVFGIGPKQSRPAERLCFALALLDPERAAMLGRAHGLDGHDGEAPSLTQPSHPRSRERGDVNTRREIRFEPKPFVS